MRACGIWFHKKQSSRAGGEGAEKVGKSDSSGSGTSVGDHGDGMGHVFYFTENRLLKGCPLRRLRFHFNSSFLQTRGPSTVLTSGAIGAPSQGPWGGSQGRQLGSPELGRKDPDSPPCGFDLSYAMTLMRHQPGSGSAGHGAAPLRGRTSCESDHTGEQRDGSAPGPAAGV